ncbi:MAG: hypothetical protein ACTSR2_10105 [Candidatus Hodarchaeales archaeon]
MKVQSPLKLTPKIILEGTRLTQKTEIAFKLNEHPRIVGPRKYRYHSPIISAEWCSFTNFPWGRGLINFDASEEFIAMETYRTWVKLFELQKYYSWIIDRFHISTIIKQRQFGREYNFRWLEKRIKPLGFCIILCYRSPESFVCARKERIKVSGKPDQYNDLSIFIKEQEDFRREVNNSILPHFEVDVSDDNLDRVCTEIADWLRDNNLLSLRE